MNKTKNIKLPEYLMVKHYKTFNVLSSLDETEQMIAVISSITDEAFDDVMTWSLPSIIEVYKRINELMIKNQQTFHPIIEWKGQLYGFRNMSKMTLGEFIDLDTLTKDIDRNLTEILALLYRPVTKNNINSATFILKSTIKALKYDVENVFDYYEIEEYDPDKRKTKASEFDEFPLDIAMGAMAFFLGTKAMLLNDTLLSSHKTQMDKVKKKMGKVKYRLVNTMVGFTHSMISQKPISYKSQETNVSPT
jgi:hypothetical protein